MDIGLNRKRNFFLLLIISLSCVKLEEFKYEKYIVGGPCEIKFFYSNPQKAQLIINEIDKELVRIDSLLNFFSEKSLISAINREHRAILESDIKDLILLADSISRLTDGLFDISIAPLLETWGFYKKKLRFPDSVEIKKAKELVDFRRLKLKGDTLIIPEGMAIDLGGIAQGFEADRIGRILKKFGVRSAIINIGGDILAIGKRPNGRLWNVGVKHPRAKGLIEVIKIEDLAVSTSGDYEKFFNHQGRRYPHIINPKTGYPADEFASITILAQDAAFADGIATAVAVMGAQRGKKFLDSLQIRGIIYYEQEHNLMRLETR